MKCLNEIRILGYLGGQPEIKYTSTGTEVCTISVATTSRWNDQRGDAQERTEWHTVVFWKKLASAVAENLAKGAPVLVTGEVRYREWEKGGQKHTSAEIHASDVIFLPHVPKNNSTTKQAGYGG